LDTSIKILKTGIRTMHVEVEHLSKSFGSVKALDDVSLDIAHNAFFTVLGPTGHGKTTLLRILAGNENPDEGKIYFDGEDVTDLSPQKRPVAMVFQDYALYRNLSVFENIASPLRAAKTFSDEVVEKNVKEKADLMGIGHLLDRRIMELSGGEQQRTAIARSLAKESELLLLDEPLTNLDYKLREKMRAELRQLKMGTVIYTTTSPLEVLAMGTHVAVILNGIILQQGESSEVYDMPKNIDVARYFSYPPMNILDAKLVKEDGTHYLEASDELKLDATKVKDLLGGKEEFILGVHGRDLKSEKESEDMLPLTATVEIVESKGSESVVHLNYMGLPMSQYVHGIATYRMGEAITLFVEPEKIYVFDSETENLLTRYKEA
jgi:glycerol transport system ATP-binding protein